MIFYLPLMEYEGSIGLVTRKKIYFYLPHMEYEGSIGFVMRKMKFFIGEFHVLGLFMAKKHDLSENKFSVCHAPLPSPLPSPPPPSPFAQICVTHTASAL
jgi:hypothetical protein